MPKISNTILNVIVWSVQSCTITLRLVTCKKKAPRSDGDIDEASVMGIPMLKSVMTLMSKWRGRVLTKNNCLYELVG